MDKAERIIILDDPDPQTAMCRGPGIVELTNYIEDPLVAITFKVEFQALLPLKPQPEQRIFTVAWQVYMPTLNSEFEIVTENIKLPCNLGNQISVQNDMVWGVPPVE